MASVEKISIAPTPEFAADIRKAVATGVTPWSETR